MIKGFIPATKKEVDDLGWKRPDVIIVTGDAYIDHPFYPAASAGRFLNSKGFRTAFIDMPDPDDREDWFRYGKPGLFFLVISGKEDSMVNNYTAFKKYRSTDPYAPGGNKTKRPDRAVIQYCNRIKEYFKEVPIVIAGPEAAGRISTHYDYWSDKLRKPILFDSKADMLLFGSIEYNLVIIGEMLRSKKKISDLKKMNGTAYITNSISDIKNRIELPSHESIVKNNKLLASHHIIIHQNQNPYNTKILVQKVMDRFLVIHKTLLPMTQEETDNIFTDFTKRPHPKYKEEIPVFRYLKEYIYSHRGCLNDISDSQDVLIHGRMISSRSPEYISREIKHFIRSKHYNKMIKTFSGPYFNQYGVTPSNIKHCTTCERLSCTLPDLCKNLRLNSYTLLNIMEDIDSIPNVRNNFYGSEPDMKLLVNDKSVLKDFLSKRNDGNVDIIVKSTLSHIRKLMGVDESESLEKDIRMMIKRAGEFGKNISFKISLTSGYPGQDKAEVAGNIEFMKQNKLAFGEINTFIPLPLTLASVQYFLGIDPVNGKGIEVDKKLSNMKSISGKYKKLKKDSKGKK